MNHNFDFNMKNTIILEDSGITGNISEFSVRRQPEKIVDKYSKFKCTY